MRRAHLHAQKERGGGRVASRKSHLVAFDTYNDANWQWWCMTTTMMTVYTKSLRVCARQKANSVRCLFSSILWYNILLLFLCMWFRIFFCECACVRGSGRQSACEVHCRRCEELSRVSLLICFIIIIIIISITIYNIYSLLFQIFLFFFINNIHFSRQYLLFRV